MVVSLTGAEARVVPRAPTGQVGADASSRSAVAVDDAYPIGAVPCRRPEGIASFRYHGARTRRINEVDGIAPSVRIRHRINDIRLQKLPKLRIVDAHPVQALRSSHAVPTALFGFAQP